MVASMAPWDSAVAILVLLYCGTGSLNWMNYEICCINAQYRGAPYLCILYLRIQLIINQVHQVLHMGSLRRGLC